MRPRPLSWKTLAVTGLIALSASTVMAFSRPAQVLIDGQRVSSDVPPVTVNRQAYLPLRAVSAGLGAQTHYDKASGTIEVIRGGDRLRIHPGERTAVLNGKHVTLRHAPFTVRGRTMVAARTLERLLGPKVRYNPRTATIDVNTTDAAVSEDGPAGGADSF
ncbi:MAG: copper amine oxidase N-terminal domain-containing protein [Candidatus Eremiobacteraeota bacterium]|nr:copper amine oxidase N-terminal domain-containing protein [Candidatus Eremiobacteraeota bacterium]MBV8355917.1 copper amine oxidase N-terminal domain-containing protein [Candidatus Eremiobacteraeota bacterium]